MSSSLNLRISGGDLLNLPHSCCPYLRPKLALLGSSGVIWVKSFGVRAVKSSDSGNSLLLPIPLSRHEVFFQYRLDLVIKSSDFRRRFVISPILLLSILTFRGILQIPYGFGC